MRFGYDGTSFAGWARQPGRRTVEGEIRRGLLRFGVVPRSASIDLEVASRTDRGVSARANAFAMHVDLKGPSLLRMLNGISPSIWCSAAAQVPDDFRVRAARRRVYRYFDPTTVRSEDRRAAAARLFSGETDVRSFGRGVPSGSPVRRTVESVTVESIPGGSMIEVRAPSFVWGMVRKIVAALREVDSERLSISRLRDAVEGTTRLTLPLAEPEPLVLWEVEYPMAWEHVWTGPNLHQARGLELARTALWVRDRVLKAVATE